MCTHYDEYVERITRCEHRTRKGKRINDAHNPLHMDRLLRWNEVWFKGEVRGRYNSCYDPEGIIVSGDGTMYDPVSGETVKPEREQK